MWCCTRYCAFENRLAYYCRYSNYNEPPSGGCNDGLSAEDDPDIVPSAQISDSHSLAENPISTHTNYIISSTNPYFKHSVEFNHISFCDTFYKNHTNQ